MVEVILGEFQGIRDGKREDTEKEKTRVNAKFWSEDDPCDCYWLLFMEP